MSCSPAKQNKQSLARASLVILLVLGIITPKLTLAAAAAFGIGLDSVTICTGNGLKRVTVSSSGEIISPDAAAELLLPSTSGEHCAPSNSPPARHTDLVIDLHFPALITLPYYHQGVATSAKDLLVNCTPPRAPPIS